VRRPRQGTQTHGERQEAGETHRCVVAEKLPSEVTVLTSPAAAQWKRQRADRRLQDESSAGYRRIGSEVLTAAGWPDGAGAVVVVSHQADAQVAQRR